MLSALIGNRLCSERVQAYNGLLYPILYSWDSAGRGGELDLSISFRPASDCSFVRRSSVFGALSFIRQRAMLLGVRFQEPPLVALFGASLPTG